MPSSSKLSFRKINGTVHLWLGWITALFLTVICLTGTIYVFHTEIEKAIYPKYFTVTPSKETLPIDTLLKIVVKETNGKVLSFRTSDEANEAWFFNIKEKKSSKNEKKERISTKKETTKEETKTERGTPYYVNPYNGVITYSGNTPASAFFKNIADIHRFFFLGKSVGKVLSGAVSLLFVLIIFSGVVIWIPKKIKHWKDGFKIKFKAHWKRVNYDLHRALGIFVFPIVLLCALTGPNWSFEWYRMGLSKVLGDEFFRQRREKPIRIDSTIHYTSKQTISIAEAMNLGNKIYAGPALTLVTIPTDSLESITVSKIHSGFGKLSVTDKININPYDGTIVKKDIFSNLGFGAKLAALVRGFHLGEFYGTFSKTIYFLACLLASSLPLTGVLIWWNKRRKKTVKSRK
ncbi:MAG: hypothetical protein DI598_13000 [Pseudopedobacter saltans]|uniref:PepSY-associated TM helix domain protein n=1 Tax=Pseudopedobacter saltans TaxID=151895 RepID=A0A2W5GIX8_9SPHI|nr:MAG: hypothetical protein DI598_13000 [Pseudopedobacter saltans]